jgi:uncharacterized membrane protein
MIARAFLRGAAGAALLFACLAAPAAGQVPAAAPPAAAPAAASAPIAPAAGTTVADRLTLGGKHVPLPPGPWDVVFSGTGEIDETDAPKKIDPATRGPILRLILVQHDAGRVRAMIEIHGNAIAHPDGWGTASECLRGDLYAAVNRYESGWDVSCLFVAASGLDGAALEGPAWAAMRRAAPQRAVQLPGVWLVAGFRVSNRHDILDVRYHFAPETLGAPPGSRDIAPWAPSVIASDPQRVDLVKDLAAWAGTMQKFVEQGLQNRLAAGPFPAPRTNAAAEIPSERADRLARLKALFDQKTIDQAEYDRQRLLIEDEATPKDLSTWTLSQVAGWKAATYRVVVTTINAGIDYVFIGQPFAAGVLVVLQVVINTTKFFFHEMMWQEWLGVAPVQRTVLPVLNFRYAAGF